MMRESLSKRSRAKGMLKAAARSLRSKTSSSLKRESSRRADASSSKRAGATTKKAVRKSAPKATQTSAKKPLSAKAKPAARAPKLKAKPKVAKGRVTTQGRKAPVKTQAKVSPKPQPKSVSSQPPAPEPPRRQVSSNVLRAFEHAVKVFNRRQFAEAKPLFESLRHRFPEEVEINARAQTYIHVCNQKLARPPSSPRDADELYDRGVVALNIGDFTNARAFFEKALRLRPDAPHVLYSLAATHAQAGAHDQAIDYLNRSIRIQPRFRTQAMNDTDFSGLREDKRFLELLGLASPFDLLESRH